MAEIKQYDDEEIKFSVTEPSTEPEKIQDEEKQEIKREILMEYSKNETTVNQKIIDKEN